ELGDGIYAWLLPGGETGVANAGVVVEDDGITVIDTLMVRSQWEPFAAAVAELGPPVRRTILTHAHIDHVGGTKAFPNSAIYGSPLTTAPPSPTPRSTARPSPATRSTRPCRSTATRSSCLRSTRSSTTWPSSARARSPI